MWCVRMQVGAQRGINYAYELHNIHKVRVFSIFNFVDILGVLFI